MIRNKSQPTLEYEKAQRILSNTFRANGMEESFVPLETIVSYSNYRKERFIFRRTVIVIMLVLFLLIPLLFLTPHAELETDPGEPGRPVYRLQVKRGNLVRRISATIENADMPVFEQENGVYYVKPTRNGEMTVRVLLYNDQFQELPVTVTDVDEEAPELLSTVVEGETICLTLRDSGAGINFAEIYADTEDEKKIEPLDRDAGHGTVTFSYTGTPLTVYIADNAGNRLQLLLAPQNG